MRKHLMSYRHTLIYQTLVKDGLYSARTEPTDVLRSFRRYVIQFKQNKKEEVDMNENTENNQQDDDIFSGFSEQESEPENEGLKSPGEAGIEPEKDDFSYLDIDEQDKSDLTFYTGGIRTLISKTARDIIRIGENLIKVKELLGHGNFGLWLEKEFSWSWKTATNFMNVAKQFKFETVSNLNTSARALYLLASASTPEAVREEFSPKLESGEEVTHSQVKEAIEKEKGTSLLLDSSEHETAFDDDQEEDSPTEAVHSPDAGSSRSYHGEAEDQFFKKPLKIHVVHLSKAVEILSGSAVEIRGYGEVTISQRLGFFIDEITDIQNDLLKRGVVRQVIDGKKPGQTAL